VRGLNRRFDLALSDLERSIEKILSYTDEMDFDDFVGDERTVDAVLWNFQVMGESVSNISESFKQDNSEIEWAEIRDFRNVVTHKYWMVDPEITWDIVQNKLPELKERINEIQD